MGPELFVTNCVIPRILLRQSARRVEGRRAYLSFRFVSVLNIVTAFTSRTQAFRATAVYGITPVQQ